MSTTKKKPTKPKKTVDEKEHDYLQGRRQTLISMLSHCLGELGVFDADEPLVLAGRLAMERLEAVQKLRGICEEHGDNDWPDNLHLADVVDKHLGNWLNEKADEKTGR